MKIVGYARVSKHDQCLGLEVQEGAIREYAGERALVLFADQGVHGDSPPESRDGLMSAIAAIDPGDELVVLRRDRLGRDVITTAMVEKLVTKAGGKVVSLGGEGNGDTPEALLVRTILDAISQYELALIRLRTKAALARKKARGEKYSREVFTDAGVIARMVAERAQGKTYKDIADGLNADGVKTARGGRWNQGTVFNIVKREG